MKEQTDSANVCHSAVIKYYNFQDIIQDIKTYEDKLEVLMKAPPTKRSKNNDGIGEVVLKRNQPDHPISKLKVEYAERLDWYKGVQLVVIDECDYVMYEYTDLFTKWMDYWRDMEIIVVLLTATPVRVGDPLERLMMS